MPPQGTAVRLTTANGGWREPDDLRPRPAFNPGGMSVWPYWARLTQMLLRMSRRYAVWERRWEQTTLRLPFWGYGAQPDVQPDAQPDGQPDAQPDGQPDAQPDGQPDAVPDAQPDAVPRHRSRDAAPDAHPDALPAAALRARGPSPLRVERAVGTDIAEGFEYEETTEVLEYYFGDTIGESDGGAASSPSLGPRPLEWPDDEGGGESGTDGVHVDV